MKLTNITSVALRNLIKLTERKESLIKEIESIEGQLASLISGKQVRTMEKRRGRPSKKGTKASSSYKKSEGTKKRAPRGAIKKKILSALKAAGEAGIKVSDLSKKIGVKNANVHVWFSSTGSKLPEIKKIGKGHYRIQEKKS
jgi:hypothetical protein